MRVGKRNVAAHRFAWILSVGPLRDGDVLCHKCDVPACVEPSHLFVGDSATNTIDAIRKGRLLPFQPTPKAAEVAAEDVLLSRESGLSWRKIERTFRLPHTTCRRMVARARAMRIGAHGGRVVGEHPAHDDVVQCASLATEIGSVGRVDDRGQR